MTTPFQKTSCGEYTQPRNTAIELPQYFYRNIAVCQFWTEFQVWRSPPIGIRLMNTDLNQSIGILLDAGHVSTHMLVRSDRLIAPQFTCYRSKVNEDIVTALDASEGLTKFMATAFIDTKSSSFNLDKEGLRELKTQVK